MPYNRKGELCHFVWFFWNATLWITDNLLSSSTKSLFFSSWKIDFFFFYLFFCFLKRLSTWVVEYIYISSSRVVIVVNVLVVVVVVFYSGETSRLITRTYWKGGLYIYKHIPACKCTFIYMYRYVVVYIQNTEEVIDRWWSIDVNRFLDL